MYYGRKAKYIVVRERLGVGGTWEEYIIPFTEMIVHSDMAENFGRRKVVSAGFIEFRGDGPVCYGESVSLDLKSRLEDTKLAEMAFGEKEDIY